MICGKIFDGKTIRFQLGIPNPIIIFPACAVLNNQKNSEWLNQPQNARNQQWSNLKSKVLINNTIKISWIGTVLRLRILCPGSGLFAISIMRIPSKHFRLHRCPDSDPVHVETWVCTALTLDLEELDLLIRPPKPFNLPSTLFNYAKSLQVSKLKGKIVINTFPSWGSNVSRLCFLKMSKTPQLLPGTPKLVFTNN